MTSKNDTKPLRLTFETFFRPEAAIGQRVRKLSGKPFGDGQKMAVVTGVEDHPVTGHRSFALASTLDGAPIKGLMHASQCYFDADHDPAWDRKDEHGK